MFPVDSPPLKKRVKHVLDVFFKDNVKARILQPDGTWVRRSPSKGHARVRSQEVFYREALDHAQAREPANRKEFSVRRGPAE
jgi:polyphosphate kinase